MFNPVSPRDLLPRRFILRPGVVSPLTCRHPRYVHCNCHGDFPRSSQRRPAPPPPASPAPAPASATHRRSASPPEDPVYKQLELSYRKTLAQILFAIREFPDATARVREILGAPEPPPDGHA